MSEYDRNPEQKRNAAVEELPAAEGPASNESPGSDWFVVQADRGQSFLEQGHLGSAREVFEQSLDRLEPGPSYRRAVIMERLGRCLLMGGSVRDGANHFRHALVVTQSLSSTSGVQALQGVLQSGLGDAFAAIGETDKARKAYEAAVAVAAAIGDHRAEGIDRDHLGVLELGQGRTAHARDHHQSALRLFEKIGEPVPQAVVRHHLGDVCAAEENWGGAETHYREAARLRETCADWNGAAQSWSAVAAVKERLGDADAAEFTYRKAAEAGAQTRNPLHFRRQLIALARFLQHRPDRVDEASDIAERALSTLTLESYAPDVWPMYGVLAEIVHKQAASADNETRAALEAQARNFWNIQEYGPRLHQTFARIGEEPSLGRAVVMQRMGRCFLMGERPELAAAFLVAARELADRLEPSDVVTTLIGVVQSELGTALREADRPSEAKQAYDAALAIAEKTGDVRGQRAALEQLIALARMRGWQDEQESLEERLRHMRPRRGCDAGTAPEIRFHDDIATDCVFDTDLLVDVARAARITIFTETPPPLSDDVRPMLCPGTRTFVDDESAVRFALPIAEPTFDRPADCVVMRKTLREVAVSGENDIVWPLMRAMDGARTVKEVLAGFPSDARQRAAKLLAALAASGVVDVSGRALGRFVHAATKKGVLLGGGLAGDEVLRLATDGNYSTYAQASGFAISDAVPQRLRPFHALTRIRRSRRDYAGRPITKEDFEALLHTACGVTGAMPWEGRELKLRAYPSSGALYTVGIYPIVLQVDALAPGVYHYAPGQSLLNAVSSDAAAIVGAALPVERQMVSGAAAMICLVGQFRRHERKYGEGGYRMMVAEAGHISQNLVLAATALNLAARPFGGVFDGLLNRALQLDENEEQFLLAVLVGHGESEVAGDDKS